MKNIQQKKTISKNFLLKECKEYSLNNSFFDPLSHSPPNDFMIKLKKRISNYCVSGIKENNDKIA
jgi:hypothetical protein